MLSIFYVPDASFYLSVITTLQNDAGFLGIPGTRWPGTHCGLLASHRGEFTYEPAQNLKGKFVSEAVRPTVATPQTEQRLHSGICFFY